MYDVVGKHVKGLIPFIDVDALRLFLSHKGVLL